MKNVSNNLFLSELEFPMDLADAFRNWRSRTDTTGVPDDVCRLIDELAGLAALEVEANGTRDFAAYCDILDIHTTLHWANGKGLVNANSEAIWRAANERFSHGLPFLNRKEMKLRLTAANGFCPLCHEKILFGEPADRPGFAVRQKCSHFVPDTVDDVQEALFSGWAWQGYRWPFALGNPVATNGGEHLSAESVAVVLASRDTGYDEADLGGGGEESSPQCGRGPDHGMISHHCSNCRRETTVALLRPLVHEALGEFLMVGRSPDMHGLGSSPMSAYECTHGCDPSGDTLCDHQSARLDRTAEALLRDEHSELRLNGAGLKLTANGVKVGFGNRSVTFTMRVSPVDQAAHYRKFCVHADRTLRDLGLVDFTD